MIDYSSVVSLSYFVVNVLFLGILAFVVYKTGHHSSVKSKSYLKDLWAQRTIYAPLIVYFYDTATDVGVLLNWYLLMKIEQADNGIDFESVDMTVFFWAGISTMILYRSLTLLYSFLEDCLVFGRWYGPILVLFELYIFQVVYESVKQNAKRIEKKKIEMEIEIASSGTKHNVIENNEEKEEEITENVPDEGEFEPAQKQRILTLGEALVESMPQIVLQSVFIIRSTNDSELNTAGTNDILMYFSIFASLLSISNKFLIWDKDGIKECGKSLKPRAEFPGCINYWYLIRVLWRFCSIITQFVVFVLVWAVMGGVWLPIFCTISYFFWFVVLWDPYISVAAIAGVYLEERTICHVLKCAEHIIALTLIGIFSTLKFSCSICTDPVHRQIINSDNNRILIFFVGGCVSLTLEIVLMVKLVKKKVLLMCK